MVSLKWSNLIPFKPCSKDSVNSVDGWNPVNSPVEQKVVYLPWFARLNSTIPNGGCLIWITNSLTQKVTCDQKNNIPLLRPPSLTHQHSHPLQGKIPNLVPFSRIVSWDLENTTQISQRFENQQSWTLDDFGTMHLRLQMTSFLGIYILFVKFQEEGISLFHFSGSPGDLVFYHLRLMSQQISISHGNLVSIHQQNETTCNMNDKNSHRNNIVYETTCTGSLWNLRGKKSPKAILDLHCKPWNLR